MPEQGIDPPFVCPWCGAVSHHPTDAAEGYCGRCHDWTREWREQSSRRVGRVDHE